MAERVAKQRFIALRVNEVSLVGEPANEVEFMTIKSTSPEEQPEPEAAGDDGSVVYLATLKAQQNATAFFAVAKGYKAGQARDGHGKWTKGGASAGGSGGSKTTAAGAPAPASGGAAPASHAGTKTVPNKQPGTGNSPVVSSVETHRAAGIEHYTTSIEHRNAGHKEAGDAHMAAMDAHGKAKYAHQDNAPNKDQLTTAAHAASEKAQAASAAAPAKKLAEVQAKATVAENAKTKADSKEAKAYHEERAQEVTTVAYNIPLGQKGQQTHDLHRIADAHRQAASDHGRVAAGGERTRGTAKVGEPTTSSKAAHALEEKFVAQHGTQAIDAAVKHNTIGAPSTAAPVGAIAKPNMTPAHPAVKVTEHKGATGGTYHAHEAPDGKVTVEYRSPKYPTQAISFDKKFSSHAEAKAAMDKHESWRMSKGAKAPVPKAASAKAKLASTIVKKHKETDMTVQAVVTEQPVVKDVSVGDEWVPMCMGKSCDSLSNICRACPAKVLCSELCHMNVPPDEPNTQENKYTPTPAAAAVAEGLFPNGGQPTTKENKPMTTPATTPAPENKEAPPAAPPVTTTDTTDVEKAKTMADHEACKGKGCVGCANTGKVAVTKEEPATEEATTKGKPQFSEERMEQLRKSLESIAGIMKEVDPEGFNKLIGQLGSGPKTPIAPTTVQSPVSVTKEDMEAAVAKTLAPFKEEIMALGKKVEEVAQVRGVSKALHEEVPATKGADQGPFWKGVL